MTVSWLKHLQLSYFSKPSADRVLYHAIARHRPESIVEMGLGQAERSVAMIELSQRYQPGSEIKYTGLDLFEGRDHRSPGITLKRAHRILGRLTSRVQLFPGNPHQSLARRGNLLLNTDLIVVDLQDSPELLAQLWTPLARLIHDHSQVYVSRWQLEKQRSQFELMDHAALHELADTNSSQQLRAA
jgi:hypothetical protein